MTRASSRPAAYLRHLHVTADECVRLYVEPSLELMIGVWGVLCAGGAYLPLSPEYPEDRVRHMIEDSRTRIVVTQHHLADRLLNLVPQGTRVVTLDDAGTWQQHRRTSRPPPTAPEVERGRRTRPTASTPPATPTGRRA